MHAVDAAALQEISTRLAIKMIETFDLDVSSVALDMTNFATYIDTTNDKAPIAQRGKAKQKRTDLRLVGLGMVVTRNRGVPLVWHAYPGNRPDVTQFPALIDQLAGSYTHLAATAAGDASSGSGSAGVGGGSGGADLGSMTPFGLSFSNISASERKSGIEYFRAISVAAGNGSTIAANATDELASTSSMCRCPISPAPTTAISDGFI